MLFRSVAKIIREHQMWRAEQSGSVAIQRYVQHLIEIEQTRAVLRASEKKDIETIVFEKDAVASLREHLEDMKTMLLGPEALFAYAARALNHLSLLRVLLTGKVNNLEIQEIKSLLPPLL